MSRAAVSNSEYVYAFGVDHTPMGTFFQVFSKDKDLMEKSEEFGSGEGLIVEYDALFGVQLHLKDDVPPRLQAKIDWLKKVHSSQRCNLSAENVIEIGMDLGFKRADLQQKVYDLWA